MTDAAAPSMVLLMAFDHDCFCPNYILIKVISMSKKSSKQRVNAAFCLLTQK